MISHRIVIAGGGVAALEAAVALRALAGNVVEPLLLCPRDDFAFRAQQVAEPFGRAAPRRLPLSEILLGLDIPHRQDALRSVEPDERVACTAGESLPYDGLLLALGGTPFPAFSHGISFDRPDDPEPFMTLLEDVEAGLASSVAFVVPEASRWALPAYDLALLLRGWARRAKRTVGISIVTFEASALIAFGTAASRRVTDVLEEAEIQLICETEAVLVSDTTMTAGSHWVTADRIVSLPQLAGPRVPGIPCDHSGFVEVDELGAVPGCPNVFAAGDGAAHDCKQGGLAAQQADLAVRAMLRGLGLHCPDPAEPPKLQGVLATPTGPLFLQATPGNGSQNGCSTASFTPLWDPPNKIVTRWLGPHLDGLVRRQTAAFAA